MISVDPAAAAQDAQRPVARSILGDIPASELGVTNSHDHLFLSSVRLPSAELTDSQLAEAELRAFAQAGGRTVVQWTPAGLGRNRSGLADLSRRTELHLISATGRHRREHYQQDRLPSAGSRFDDVRLAKTFIADIEAATMPCGLVKVGTGFHHLDDDEKCSLRAAANAHLETGVPIAVHLEAGSGGMLVLDYLSTFGVRPESVILGHVGRNPDLYELRDLASTGSWLGFDGPSRANRQTDWRLFDVLAALAADHADQLLLGGDTTTAEARSVVSGPGMPALLLHTGQRVLEIFGSELWTAIFERNPARAFALRSR